VRHGVRRVVDLRWDEEREHDPPRELEVEIVHVSLFGRMDPEYGAADDAAWEAAPDVTTGFAERYLAYLEEHRPRFGEALAALADAPDGAVLVHCGGGKDRTGLVCALLLRLAGVGAETVAADYALSGPRMAAALERRWPLDPDADEAERRSRERALHAPHDAMLRVLDGLEERYGGVDGYLRAAGLDDGRLARLRERLRG
ncbi:MAG: tyrosine-protein phosphatase, partial [Gaiellaceae bacterium]